MSTHYHLLLETPEANLVSGMKWFQGTFTQRNNRYHRTWGHLFQGRYKAKVIDDSDLEGLRKGDSRKLLLAGFLKRHFMVTNAWLSEQLNMGHPSRSSAAGCLYANPPAGLKRQKQKLEMTLKLSD